MIFPFFLLFPAQQKKDSDPTKGCFSPSEVKKWAIDDLNNTISWLEGQEEKVIHYAFSGSVLSLHRKCIDTHACTYEPVCFCCNNLCVLDRKLVRGTSRFRSYVVLSNEFLWTM